MTLSPQLADDMSTRGITLGHTCLSGSSQYYADGFWHTNDESAWWLELGPGQLAATMARYATSQNDQYKAMAIATVDRAILYNLRPLQTGLPVTPPGSTPITYTMFAAGYEGVLDPSNDDTCTIEVIASIGWIMQMLGSGLDAARAASWLQTLKYCCAWLDKINGNTVYYINGNFAAHLCLAYYTVAALCRASGDEAAYQTHIAMYERAYATMVTPSVNNVGAATTWNGYGLLTDTAGVQWDWSDYTAHLTETNGYVGPNPSPTLDYDYSTLALDLLARLYLMKRDHRIMRAVNSIHNAVAARINTTTWVIDETGGSRHSLSQGFVFNWLAVTALVGLRNLTRTMFSDVNVKAAWDTQTIGSLSANLTTAQVAAGTQRRWGLTIATVIHAANTANKQVT